MLQVKPIHREKGSQKFQLINQGSFPSHFFKPVSKILQSISSLLLGDPSQVLFSSSSAPEMLFKSSGKKSASWADPQQVFFNGHTPSGQGSWRYPLHWSIIWPCIIQWKGIPEMFYRPLEAPFEVFSLSFTLPGITLWHPQTSREVNINAGRKYLSHKFNYRALKASLITYCRRGSYCW